MNTLQTINYKVRIKMVKRFLFIVLFIFIDHSEGGVLYVSPFGSGLGGHSWETAYQKVTDAIAQSASGDSIWVREGDYDEAPFVTKRLFLLGGFVGTESEESQRNPHIHKTRIRLTSGILPAIRCTAPCTIDGFDVTSLNNIGMTIYRASVIVVDTTFTNCHSLGTGGGVGITEGTIDMLRCNIVKNVATSLAGGMMIESHSTATITDCLIANNRGYAQGGGIACAFSTLIMNSCKILKNVADNSNPEAFSSGGGLEVANSTTSINNCLIAGNGADRGADIRVSNTNDTPEFQNCTVTSSGQNRIFWDHKPPLFQNAVIWGSNGMLVRGNAAEGDADITHSTIQGGYPGEGNISDDPMFRDAANGDFHLLADSPCIDTAGTSGPNDDLDGKARPVDIPGVGREGPDTFDMGCYEFQLSDFPTPVPAPTPTMNPRSDVNQSGKVDTSDLLILIEDWQRTMTR
jgi:hypothetical protein